MFGSKKPLKKTGSSSSPAPDAQLADYNAYVKNSGSEISFREYKEQVAAGTLNSQHVVVDPSIAAVVTESNEAGQEITAAAVATSQVTEESITAVVETTSEVTQPAPVITAPTVESAEVESDSDEEDLAAIANLGAELEAAAIKEKIEKEAAEKLAAEKEAAEKLAAEKLAAEKEAAEKLAAEKEAAEKLAAELLAAEKLAAELLAAEKLAAEKAAAEKDAADLLAAEKEVAEKLAADKLAADKLAAELLAAEKLAADKAAAEKDAAEKLAAELLAAEKLAAEKLAAEKLAAEKEAARTAKNAKRLSLRTTKLSVLEPILTRLIAKESVENQAQLNPVLAQLKTEYLAGNESAEMLVDECIKAIAALPPEAKTLANSDALVKAFMDKYVAAAGITVGITSPATLAAPVVPVAASSATNVEAPVTSASSETKEQKRERLLAAAKAKMKM